MEATVERHNARRASLAKVTYSLSEVAALCGLSYTTLYEAVRAGEFPVKPLRIGRKYLFLQTEVDKLLGLAKDESK